MGMLSSALLDHLMKLSAKTGGRLVVVDSSDSSTVVLLSLKEYESMVTGRVPAGTDVRIQVKKRTESGAAHETARANKEISVLRSGQIEEGSVQRDEAPVVLEKITEGPLEDAKFLEEQIEP